MKKFMKRAAYWVLDVVALAAAFWGGMGHAKGRGESATIQVIGAATLVAICFILKFRLSRTWRKDPASDKQKTFADDLGLSYSPRITKGDLAEKIERAIKR